MFDTSHHLESLIKLAETAGHAIMRYHTDGYNITAKTDGSPVTHADQASEDIILAGLKALAPDIPVIAEEQAEAGIAPDISANAEYWLVDPLDGTKEFIKGTDDFAVNIGLVRHGTPVFGIVYLPSTQDIYFGGEGIGAFFNRNPISTLPYIKDEGLIIVGSASHPDSDNGKRRKAMLKDHTVQKYTTRGSGIKFCLIADGTAHLYPRFVPTYEWDTCAAHAMLLQVGGDIIDFETGQRLAYGKKHFRNGNIITATTEILDFLTE